MEFLTKPAVVVAAWAVCAAGSYSLARMVRTDYEHKVEACYIENGIEAQCDEPFKDERYFAGACVIIATVIAVDGVALGSIKLLDKLKNND
jgi:hypothetical protein